MSATVIFTWSGACFLIVGLLLLFEANRRQVQAIATRTTYRDLTGELRESGWWTRASALARSNRAYGLGVFMTLTGIVLQAIGSTIGCR